LLKNLFYIINKYISYFFILLIRIYRYLVSPILGKTCRHYPTCSEYAISGIRQSGFFIALPKILLRILKCNKFFSGAYDPYCKNKLGD
jgi:uncharacterized protein